MKKSAEEVFLELKEDISTYAELKLELIKLNAYEQTGKVLTVLSYGLILSALITTAILFALLTLGFLLSEWLRSTVAGFGIVVALYIIQIVILILNRKRIRRKILNIIIAALVTNERAKSDSKANSGHDEPNETANEDEQKKDATTNPEPERNSPE